MRIFLDACIDPRVAELFADHEVSTAFDLGWQALQDRDILRRCAGLFDVLLTADRGFEHEHNRSKLTFGIVIVHTSKNKVEFYRRLEKDLRRAVASAGAEDVIHVP